MIRDEIISKIQRTVDEVVDSGYARSTIFYGGMAKERVALLHKIANLCDKQGNIICKILPEKASLKTQIDTIMQDILLDTCTQAEKSKRAEGLLRTFQRKWNLSDCVDLPGDYVGHGLTDTGDLSNDLLELLLVLGETMRKEEKVFCLLMGEIQRYSREELEALAIALHRCNQKEVPICVIGTGTSAMLRQMGRAKAYAERLFLFEKIE